ncbi:MAG: VOC family protein [Rhodospirillaceae bacterium]|nr:VOC family protein [Rhodospirillaceae bacterium]
MAASPVVTGGRVLHAMLRVADMDRTLAFYCGLLGMSVQWERRHDDGYRNVFVGYGSGATTALIEFGCRPGADGYDKARGFDHIAIAVADVAGACAGLARHGVTIVREPKAAASGALIALIEDPDGYRLELIQAKPGSPGGAPF